MKKILVMGLPGSGKTTFSEHLRMELQLKGYTCIHYNADVIRDMYQDWDFSIEGRIRQAQRMKHLSDTAMTDFAICDFVAPTKEIRNIFAADYTVWMNTEEKSQYEDTNAIFEKPRIGEWNYIVKVKDANNTVSYFIDIVLQTPRPS